MSDGTTMRPWKLAGRDVGNKSGGDVAIVPFWNAGGTDGDPWWWDGDVVLTSGCYDENRLNVSSDDLALIVRAVNAHDPLVQALNETLEALDSAIGSAVNGEFSQRDYDRWDGVRTSAELTISKHVAAAGDKKDS